MSVLLWVDVLMWSQSVTLINLITRSRCKLQLITLICLTTEIKYWSIKTWISLHHHDPEATTSGHLTHIQLQKVKDPFLTTVNVASFQLRKSNSLLCHQVAPRAKH